MTTISPFASYIIIKQDEQIPVSFSLDASYERQIYSSQLLNDFNSDMTGNFYSIGASLFSNFEVSDGMIIQPSIGFTYITGELIVEDEFATYTEDDNTTSFSLGLSLIFHTSPTNIFVVSPSLGFGEDVTTFGISLGFVFPQN